MANEIIKLLEYVKPFVQGAFMGYMILVSAVVAIVITIFIIALRTILNNKQR